MSVTVEKGISPHSEPHSKKNIKHNGVVEKANKFQRTQQKLFNAIAIQEGFTEYEIETLLIPSTGGNYLGILYKVNIRGKKLNKSDELHLFVKIAADNEGLRTMFPLHEAYCNEMFAYNVISRIYNDLQTDANIPEAQMFKFTKFYGSVDTNRGEAIALDNLNYKNYTVQDRFKSISLEFAKIAIDNAAKFHALSYVLEKHDPVYFNEIIKSKTGNMYLHNGGPERIRKFASKIIPNALKNLRNDDYSKRLEKFCNEMCEDISKYVKTNNYPVLCHGDYRVNNLLVKYQNDKLSSLIPIDYQLIHYGSPLNDIIYFIFGATDSEFRRLHLDYIFEFYYECLDNFLKYFSYDVSDIYPKKEFDADVKSHLMFGLVIGVYGLPVLLASEETVPDLEDLEERTFEEIYSAPNEIFLQRYNGIIEDYASWKYL